MTLVSWTAINSINLPLQELRIIISIENFGVLKNLWL